MRAAIINDFRQDLSIETISDPICLDNGVVLEVAACGVCRSHYHGWTGGLLKVTKGSVLGHEYCGTVVEAINSIAQSTTVFVPDVVKFADNRAPSLRHTQ